MLSPRGGKALERVIGSSSPFVIPPSFLIPAFQTSQSRQPQRGRRAFSSTSHPQSKLGRIPLSIPPGVELSISEPRVKHDPTSWKQIPRRTVSVQGPRGSIDLELPEYVNLDHDTAQRQATLSIEDHNVKQQREMWGTTWSYLQNHILGVSEGHTAILRLVGVGYRATVEPRKNKEEYPDQKFVCLKLGFTHPVELPVPLGVTASTPQPTRILLEGCDKETVLSFAAKIRRWRVPEPYKGKGIFVNDETIKLKQKKIK